MKTILGFILICSVISYLHGTEIFERAEDVASYNMFKKDFKRSYIDSKEERSRKAVFMKNLRRIKKNNADFANGAVSYKLALNKFSDWTWDEFKSRYLANPMNESLRLRESTPILRAAPMSVDWEAQGYVTPVEEQGECGSCYAFTAAGAVEGQYYKKNKKLERLSKSQIVDCSRPPDNLGCDGGYMTSSFQYLIRTGGQMKESDYPYVPKKSRCKFSKSKVFAKLKSFVRVPPNEASLQNAVATIGPIATGIAVSDDFQLYESGVFTSKECSKTPINHAVLIVGYDSRGKKYWRFKNTWGTGWGEKGYMRIAKDARNMCKIASLASYPVL